MPEPTLANSDHIADAKDLGNATGVLPAEILTDALAANPIAARAAAQIDEDLINAQNFAEKKIAGWLTAGSGVAAPVRLMQMGDSLASGLGLGPRMAPAGVIGLRRTSGLTTGTVTPLSGRFDYWINGEAEEFAVGSTAQYTFGGQPAGDLIGNKASIAYIKKSGGGSFDLEYQVNGTGAWTTLATIDTANATTIGAVNTYDLPTSLFPSYRLRINNVVTGSVVVLFPGIYNSNGGGVIWMPVSALSGVDLVQSITTPAAVFNPVWTFLAPDVVLACYADGGGNWDVGGAWRTIYASAIAAYAQTDFVVISRNPMADEAGHEAQRVAQRAWAAETGQTWLNGHSMFRSYEIANARGFMKDPVHLSDDLGVAARNSQLWARLPLGLRKLGAEGGLYGNGGIAAEVTSQGYPTQIESGPYTFRRSVNLRGKSLSFNNTATPMDSSDQVVMSNIGGYLSVVSQGTTYAKVGGAGTETGFNAGSLGAKLGSELLPWKLWATGIQTAYSTKTAAYTATSQDHTLLCNATSAAFTITLPDAASFLHKGRIYVIKKIDASVNAITIDGNGSQTIDGALTVDLTAQWQVLRIQSDGANWFVL